LRICPALFILASAPPVLFNGLHAQQADRLTILTYNIQIGTGMDRKVDLARTAAVIKSVAPDLVALQEVDRKARRTGGVDQAVELSRLTGMHLIFGKASDREGVDRDGGDYGNAILSRFPIKRSQNRALPNTPNFELRAVLEVEVDWPQRNGERIPVRFFGTHFDNASEADRVASARMLNDLARLEPEMPTILAGDLNSVPSSEPAKILGQQWTPAAAGETLTYPANTPRRQIDYIFFRPARTWRVIRVQAVDEPAASDHRPVLAVLEYAP
jgi:endonuclease/exonuclease/phosphatase family metal-dependent hydrolase